MAVLIKPFVAKTLGVCIEDASLPEDGKGQIMLRQRYGAVEDEASNVRIIADVRRSALQHEGGLEPRAADRLRGDPSLYPGRLAVTQVGGMRHVSR